MKSLRTLNFTDFCYVPGVDVSGRQITEFNSGSNFETSNFV